MPQTTANARAFLPRFLEAGVAAVPIPEMSTLALVALGVAVGLMRKNGL